MTSISRLDLARQQLQFVRNYTKSLLDGLCEEDWFTVPTGAPTHIAWQVGHLAMAQYMLTLLRLRGKVDADEPLISKRFLKRFIKGSTPQSDRAANLSMHEIRGTFDRVFDQLLVEWTNFTEADLDVPVVEPFIGYPNRFGSLLFCSHHEQLHAGQIGLIRRLLGKPPVR